MIKRYDSQLSICIHGGWVKFEDHVADKRELVEMLEKLLLKPEPPYQGIHDAMAASALTVIAKDLIAKHKEGV